LFKEAAGRPELVLVNLGYPSKKEEEACECPHRSAVIFVIQNSEEQGGGNVSTEEEVETLGVLGEYGCQPRKFLGQGKNQAFADFQVPLTGMETTMSTADA